MRIFRYTLSATEYLSVDWKTSGKVMINITGNVRLGYDQQMMAAGSYFSLKDGQTFVFDQPASIGNQLLYLIGEAGGETVEVWITGEEVVA